MDLNSIKEWFQGRLAAMQASPTQDGFRTMRAASLDDTINASPLGRVLTGASKIVQGALSPTDEYGNPNVDLGMMSLSKPFTEMLRPTARAEKAKRIATRLEDFAQSLWHRSDDRARAAMDINDILEVAPTTSVNTEGYTWADAARFSNEASQLNKRGVRNRQRADQLFQLANETETIRTTNPVTFESSLRQTLAREGMPESYTPKMLQQLTNKLPGQGIKKEELKWLGWNDYVERRMREGKRVSRQELLDWVDQNTIDVVEHTGKKDSFAEPGDIMSDADFNPRYETYTLPGGDNYREVLLQWGNKESTGKSRHDFSEWLKGQNVNSREEWMALPKEQQDTFAEMFHQDYQSGHFDPPNILAHTRLKDRVTPDGKKVLFVEEIQSDWHQAKRDQPKREAWNKRVAEWKTQNGIDNPKYYAALANANESIPDAPFADNWDELTMKRILKMASEGGYDAVGWTTGAHQQKRYNQTLMRGADEIKWDPDINSLKLYKDGRLVKGEDRVTAERLPEVVGWDTAEQILSKTFRETPELRGNYITYGDYRGEYMPTNGLYRLQSPGGLVSTHKTYDDMVAAMDPSFAPVTIQTKDMTIGKSGMETFYDKILPARAQALAKRHGGNYRQGQIETKQPTKVIGDLTLRDLRQREPELTGTIADLGRQMGFHTIGPYDAIIRARNAQLIDNATYENMLGRIREAMNNGQYENVHMLDLPPQTRESIKAKAFPLFEAAPVLGLAELYRRNLNAVERKRSQE